MHLFNFDPHLYSQLITYPMEIIPIADLVLRNIAASITQRKPDDLSLIHVRPYNTEFIHSIRDLEPRDINHLITVRGMISRISQIFPDMKVACFICEICGKREQSVIDHGKIEEPGRCSNCKEVLTLKLNHNQCRYANKQLIKMQEIPGSIPEGEVPRNIELYAFDELVDSVRAGDKMEVVGVYRVVASRLRPQTRNLNSVCTNYIDVVHFHRLETETSCWSTSMTLTDVLIHQKYEDHHMEAQMERREDELRMLAQTPDIYQRLVQSFAPSIHGHDEIKKGLLCQLFGGVMKNFDGGKIRGDINVLLVGDPGTSKSQFLGFANMIAPRGIYTSGRGSTAVGLSAYIAKDPEMRNE